MRPQRDDIAAPEFLPGLPWFGGAAAQMAELTAAGPVLVHFWDLAQLNSVRTLPYLRAWHQRYGEAGLAVLGIHSPRYPFTADAKLVKRAVEELEIPYRVASDSEHAVWADYGCEGWPSLFLWGRGGALRWHHFGEGEYRGTEEAIQGLLGEAGDGIDLRQGDPRLELPEPLAPLRPSDAPGALVAPPSQEVFPGGSVAEPWVAGSDGETIELSYAAGGAYAAVEGEGELLASLDAGPERPAERITPGLFELATHERHEPHRLRVRPAPGQPVYAVSFAAGVPDAAGSRES